VVELDDAGVDDGSAMDMTDSRGEEASKTSSCSIFMVAGTASVRGGERGVAVIVLVLMVFEKKQSKVGSPIVWFGSVVMSSSGHSERLSLGACCAEKRPEWHVRSLM